MTDGSNGSHSPEDLDPTYLDEVKAPDFYSQPPGVQARILGNSLFPKLTAVDPVPTGEPVESYEATTATATEETELAEASDSHPAGHIPKGATVIGESYKEQAERIGHPAINPDQYTDKTEDRPPHLRSVD